MSLLEIKKQQGQLANGFYGREANLTHLKHWFEDKSEKTPNFMYVTGDSGVGKTSLIRNFIEDLSDDRIYIATNKEDLTNNTGPYFTVITLFEQIINTWLLLPDRKLREIEQVLRQGLGTQQSVIVETFPRLEILLGKTTKKYRKPSFVFEHWFNEALMSLVRCVQTINTKTLFFVDDLQWADSASIRFFEYWSGQKRTPEIRVIFTHRESENRQNELAKRTFYRRIQDFNFEEHKLTGLTRETINFWLAESFEIHPDAKSKFQEFIYQVTKGNPLFINLICSYLIREKGLFYDKTERVWHFNPSNAKKLDRNKRIVEYVLDEMEALSIEVIELLGIGAVIGSRCTVALLSGVTDLAYSEVIKRLAPAVDLGILEFLGNDNASIGSCSYRFVHDKMQDSAYSLLSEEKKRWIHFSIGKCYAKALGSAASDRNIYDIVDQYNKCVSYFTTENERVSLAQMNLQAGKKAKSVSAFHLALEYFNLVIQLIEDHIEFWEKEMVFEVYLEAGDTAFLKKDFVSSVMFYESALKYSSTKMEMAQVHYHFLKMHVLVNDSVSAWVSAVEGLNLIGVKFPKEISTINYLWEQFRARRNLKTICSDRWQDVAISEDKTATLAFLILQELYEISRLYTQRQTDMIVYKGINLLIDSGKNPLGVFSISAYAAKMGLVYGNIEKGNELIKLAISFSQKQDDAIVSGRSMRFEFGQFGFLLEHSRRHLYSLNKAFALSKEAGDYGTACDTALLIIENKLVMGDSISEIVNQLVDFESFLMQEGNSEVRFCVRAIEMACEVLVYNEDKTFKRFLDYLEENERFVSPDKVEKTKVISELSGLINHRANHFFNESWFTTMQFKRLSLIEVMRIFIAIEGISRNGLDQKKYWIKRLKKARVFFKKRISSNEGNTAVLLAFVNAVIAQFKGENRLVIAHYDTAIHYADLYEYVHFKAVLNEKMANFYQDHQRIGQALVHYNESILCYEKWGANFKTGTLKQEVQKIIDFENTRLIGK